MINEQAAIIAAASYLGGIQEKFVESNTVRALRISNLAKELLDVLDRGTLVSAARAPRSGGQ